MTKYRNNSARMHEKFAFSRRFFSRRKAAENFSQREIFQRL